VLFDLTLTAFGPLRARAELRSFYSGKAAIAGRDWQLGLVNDDPTSRAGFPTGASLLLRPWEQRDQPFRVGLGTIDAFPFSAHLFFQSQAYRLVSAFDFHTSPTNGRLTLTPQSVDLGQLAVRGQFIRRLMLHDGPWTVVLDEPTGTMPVPVGTYAAYRIQLQQGDVAAYPTVWPADRGIQENVVIESGGLTQLTAGGPLTNMVEVQRRSQHVVFNHRLVGADGHSYRLTNLDHSQPPRFTVYQGDQAVASGNFEFG
jgi:hypothetical protein